MKHIGILGHSAEGAALCFQTIVREAAECLGEQNHPVITMNIRAMGPTMPLWEGFELSELSEIFHSSLESLERSGADFFICPDNTAHLAIAAMEADFPIPGIHIVDVVQNEMIRNNFRSAGLLGTKWTMTSDLYKRSQEDGGPAILIPEQAERDYVNSAIFNELCNGQFKADTRSRFTDIIQTLKNDGADCVILGCTEIPLLIEQVDSPLPILDSTRLLARSAIAHAIGVEKRNGSLRQRF